MLVSSIRDYDRRVDVRGCLPANVVILFSTA